MRCLFLLEYMQVTGEMQVETSDCSVQTFRVSSAPQVSQYVDTALTEDRRRHPDIHVDVRSFSAAWNYSRKTRGVWNTTG